MVGEINNVYHRKVKFHYFNLLVTYTNTSHQMNEKFRYFKLKKRNVDKVLK